MEFGLGKLEAFFLIYGSALATAMSYTQYLWSLYTEDPANGSQVDGVVQARNTRGVTISTVCRIFVPPLILSKEDTDNFTEEISELFDLNMPTEILGG